jgi:hypothetical protein
MSELKLVFVASVRVFEHNSTWKRETKIVVSDHIYNIRETDRKKVRETNNV